MAKPMDQYTWKELLVGFVVDEPGSAREYKTGDWASMHPEWDESKCIKCGLCWLYCPDAAVYQKEDGFFTADLDYCKGCGICAAECWPGAITMIED
jgi:pyruvate ferredoxin oxidoreductase delta subunit